MGKYLVIISVVLTIYSLIECAQTEPDNVRNLPKWGWILIIIVFSIPIPIGPIAWFIAGRPKGKGFGGFKAKRKVLPPDDNPDFLKGL